MSDKTSIVSLRTLAERVGLAPCSVSAVLNDTPAARAIPQRTKDRIYRAAGELNYRPNLWARSLRTKRTRMVAVVTSDIGRNTVACVAAGVQRRLQAMGYLLALGPSDCTSENISVQLHQRGIEGVIAIDATLSHGLKLPLACVDLESMSLVEPLGREMRAWLVELGESAADTVVQQIESETAPRKVKVVPKC